MAGEVDLAAIMERHVPHPYWTALGYTEFVNCVVCGTTWPCDTRKLLALAESQAQRIAALETQIAEMEDAYRMAESASHA